MAFLFAESEALKKKLKGLSVPTSSGSIPVGVKFSNPESELSKQTFPLIVIQFVGFNKADDREHRGTVRLRYAPEGHAPWWGPDDVSYDPKDSPYMADYPVPVDLDYQVNVLCRKAQHDLLLLGAMADHDYLPARFGYLTVDADHTIRTLELVGGPTPDSRQDNDGSRLITQTYLVRIASEYPPEVLDRAAEVMSINIDVTNYPGGIPDEFYSGD